MDNVWAIATSISDRAKVIIRSSTESVRATVSRKIRRLIGRYPCLQNTTLSEVFRPPFSEDFNLSLLLVAFSTAMGVEIKAPINQDVWWDLFYHLAVPLASGHIGLGAHCLSSLASTKHLSWVGIPAVDHIRDAPYIHVRVCFKDLEIFDDPASHFRPVSKEKVGELQAKLGPSFIEYKDDDVVFIHQSVLMILFAAHISSAGVEFCTWERPENEHSFISRMEKFKYDEVLVFVSNTGYNNHNLLKGLYVATDHLEAAGVQFRVYPNKSEVFWSQNKIGDIRMLDEIAAKAQTWRPRTCYGKGDCTLRDLESDQMVLKRSHSCAGADVDIVDVTQRKRLLCRIPTQAQAARRTRRIKRTRCSGEREHEVFYFHQQFVPTFRSIGEFRVMVCDGQVLAAFR